MALDPRYVKAISLQEPFVSKDTQMPLANGKLKFFRDVSRETTKDVFVISGTAPNYTYTNVGSEITLNNSGAPQYNGADVNIYYFPYDDDGVLDLYFVRIEDAGEVEQFTREAHPNVFGPSSDGDNGGSPFTNYIPNGQFVSHVDIENNGLITEPVTDVALGGWTFERPAGSTSVDNVTFTRFNSYTENPEATPRYAIDIISSGGGAGDLFKDLRLKFDDVNKFASDSQLFTIKFSAESLIGTLNDVELVLIKNYGTGGDVETETNIENFNITPAFSSYLATFTFGDNVGKSIGANDDDFLQLALRFPVNSIYHGRLTNFMLREGNFSELDFPDTTSRQSISQFLGGAFPKPATDGSDLYLTPRLTQTGWEYDRSEIGRVIAKSTGDIEVGELLADGSSYFTNEKSADGIPYSRLQQKYYDPNTRTMCYGTGLDYMSSYVPSVPTLDSMLIVANSSGIAANAADGTAPTGFNFYDCYTSLASDYEINAWIENPGNGYCQLQTEGVTGQPSDSLAPTDTGITFKEIIDGTSQTPLEFIAFYPDASTFAVGASNAKHWLIDTPTTDYYVWYRTEAQDELDPAVPGRTGILVNVYSTDTAIGVAEKTTAALSNYAASSIDAPALPPASSFFTVSVPTENFYVWYTVDGAGTDPAPPNTTGIQVDILNSDTPLEALEKTQIAINTRQFAIPDYRGLFLRGITGSRTDIGLDDPTMRFSRVNFKHADVTLGDVGSEELSRGRRHTHAALSNAVSTPTPSSHVSDVQANITGSPPAGFVQRPITFGSGADTNINVSTLTTVLTVSTTVSTDIEESQNKESRPANAYVTYVIKY